MDDDTRRQLKIDLAKLRFQSGQDILLVDEDYQQQQQQQQIALPLDELTLISVK